MISTREFSEQFENQVQIHDCILWMNHINDSYTIKLSLGGHAPVEVINSPSYEKVCNIYEYLSVCPTNTPLHALYFAYK